MKTLLINLQSRVIKNEDFRIWNGHTADGLNAVETNNKYLSLEEQKKAFTELIWRFTETKGI